MKKIVSLMLILVMMLSVVSFNTSAAGVYLNADFSTWNETTFYNNFMVGEFHVDDSERVLYGYSEAKALQSMYSDPEGPFDNTLNTWLTYDASITFSMADDDISEDERNISMSYCNDNLWVKGLSQGRQFISVAYNIEARQFEATTSLDGEDIVLADPIARELDTDGNTYYTLGMSVQKNRIRFFFDNELLFDIDGTSYLVGDTINSPFFFWNGGNYLKIKNITVASDGYLFPATDNNQGGQAQPSQPQATQAPATSRVENVEVTDEKGNVVTDEAGNKVTEQVIITDAPVADTNTNPGVGGNSTSTGDSAFIVVAALVAAIGTALIVRKVNAQ